MGRIFRQLKDVNFSIIAPYGKDFDQYKNGIRLFPSNAQGGVTLEYHNISTKYGRIQKAFNRESAIPVKLTKAIIEEISRADALIIAILLPNYTPAYVEKLISYTKPNCLKVLSPQGYFRDFDAENNVTKRKFKEHGSLLHLFNYMILSRDDYPNIGQKSLCWLKELDTKALITKAQDGVDVVSKDSILSYPTTPVRHVVDSTGAGDVFSAAFTYKFVQTGEEKEAIDFAQKIAGFSVKLTPYEISVLT